MADLWRPAEVYGIVRQVVNFGLSKFSQNPNPWPKPPLSCPLAEFAADVDYL